MKNYQQVQSVLDGIIEDFQIEASRINIEFLFGLHKSFALGSVKGVRMLYITSPEINKLCDVTKEAIQQYPFKAASQLPKSAGLPGALDHTACETFPGATFSGVQND